MLIHRRPERGVAPKWLKPISRTVLSRQQRETKREKLNMLTWNRRLSKAGAPCRVGADRAKRYKNGVGYGLPIVQARPELEYLQSYRVRKSRSENRYRTEERLYDDGRPETVFWVEDIRTGERVTDPAILTAVVDVANDRSKWPYRVDMPTKPGRRKVYDGEYAIGKPSRNSGKAQIVFDKPGPGELKRHSLGLHCDCQPCVQRTN